MTAWDVVKWWAVLYGIVGVIHGTVIAIGYGQSEPFTRKTLGVCILLFLYAIPAWLYHTTREAYLDALACNNNTKA